MIKKDLSSVSRGKIVHINFEILFLLLRVFILIKITLPFLQISSLIFSFLFNSKECLYVLKLIIGKTISCVVSFDLHDCEKLPTFV